MENKFLGITPPMGWNSWNTFTWEINDKLIREAADAFVSEGLKDAGYEYVVIDDCWSLHERDENGRLQAAPLWESRERCPRRNAQNGRAFLRR